MITIIDYDTGNLRSVANALGRLGAEYRITADPAAIRAAERVLLPGVGEASSAMAKLRERGLPDVIRSLKCPVLGICIGVQLLCRRSEEGDTECLGIFDNEVRRLRTEGLKVPHMGWDSIEDLRGPLFDGLDEGAYVYYVRRRTPTRSPGRPTERRSAPRSGATTSSERSFTRKRALRSASASCKTF